jgi:TRAP-type C4-dicarboxylate transport system permease small subunit
VVYQLMVTIEQDLASRPGEGWTLVAVLLAFIGAMAWASTPQLGSLGKRAGATAAIVVGVVGLTSMLTSWESSSVYRLLLLGFSIPVALTLWKNVHRRYMVIYGVCTAIAFYAFGNLPTGYSWSQSYSLLLLLWVGFLGASMAARQRRHLKIDLARKLLSPEKVPAFNALSYLAAAIFSGIVFYLSYIYMFGPDSTYLTPIWDAAAWLPESTRQELMTGFPLPDDASFYRRAMQVVFSPSEPGEVPDYLKVLAIPVSFFLITVRFLGHSIVFARMAARHESFDESMEAH